MKYVRHRLAPDRRHNRIRLMEMRLKTTGPALRGMQGIVFLGRRPQTPSRRGLPSSREDRKHKKLTPTLRYLYCYSAYYHVDSGRHRRRQTPHPRRRRQW